MGQKRIAPLFIDPFSFLEVTLSTSDLKFIFSFEKPNIRPQSNQCMKNFIKNSVQSENGFDNLDIFSPLGLVIKYNLQINSMIYNFT